MRYVAAIAAGALLTAAPAFAANEPPCDEFIGYIAEYYNGLATDTNARPERQRFYRDMIIVYAELYQAMSCDGVDLRKALRRVPQTDILQREEGLRYEQ